MNAYEILNKVRSEIDVAQTILASFPDGVTLSSPHINRAAELLLLYHSKTQQSFPDLINNNQIYSPTKKEQLNTYWELIKSSNVYFDNINSSCDTLSTKNAHDLLDAIRDIYHCCVAVSGSEIPLLQRIFHSNKLLLSIYLPIAILIMGYVLFGTINPMKWFYDPLDKFIVTRFSQDFGIINYNRSVSGGQLRINNQYYSYGYGTHANSIIKIRFSKKASILSGACGVDDATKSGGTIQCLIKSGDNILFSSSTISGGMQPTQFAVNVQGLDGVDLVISDAGDGINSDHGNWVNLLLK